MAEPLPWERNWSAGAAPVGGSPVGRPVIRRAPPPVKPDKPQPIAGYPGYFLGPDGKPFKPEGLPEKPPAKSEGDDVKLQQKRASLQSLEEQINRVEQLYRDGLKDEALGVISSLGEYLPTPENRQFDAASAGLAEQGLSAFRVPGVGAQSDTELRQFVQANRPSASDYDTTIEEKLRQLRGRVDATRQEMGLEPAKWLGSEAPPAPEQQELEAAPPQLAPSSGETRSVIDPKAQKLAGRIGSLIAQGADRNRIMGMAVGADPSLRNDPKFRAAVDEALKFRSGPNWQQWQRLNPGKAYPFDPGFYTREEPLSAVESGLTQAAQTAPGAYVARAGDAVTAGNLDRLAGLTGADQEGARMALELAGRENPGASLLGDITGGTLAALTGEAGLARLGMAPGLLRGFTADASYGGLTNASNAQEGNFLGNLATGAALGGAGSLGGQGLLRATGAAARGVTAPSVRYLADDLRLPMTIGQVVGQSGRAGAVVKNIEDKLAGSGFDAGGIGARQVEGLQKLNTKAFDRALEPIGENVAGQYAEDAVATAQDKVGQAFERALSGKVATVDADFITSATRAKAAIQRLPRVGAEIEDSIDELVNEFFDPATGSINGENMQALLRSLEAVKKSYANDPLAHRIGKSVELVSNSIEDMFRRQAPEVMPQYDAAKLAFKRVSILEDAVLKAKDRGGVFTPHQLGAADKSNTIRFGGKHKAARGGGEFHDMQRAAQDVLPNKVPDSGTAGRIIVPAALVSGAAGTGAAFGDAQSGGQTGLGLATLIALAYSRVGQRGLTKLVKPGGPRGTAIGNAATRAARIAGAGTTAALVGPRD